MTGDGKMPCPWCGGVDLGFERMTKSKGAMRCGDCGARGPLAHSDGDGDGERSPVAVEAWNRRADMDADLKWNAQRELDRKDPL